MRRTLAVLTVIVLPGLFATAQEPAKPEPAKEAAQEPGAPFFEKFDLNKDGKVEWDEYQKVMTGFAALDVDRDGAITPADMAKVVTRRQERVHKEMHQQMQWRMRHPGMRGGFGPRGGGWGRRGGFGPQGGWRGQDGGGWGGGGGGFGPGPQGPGRGGPMGPGPRPPEPPRDAPQPPR